MRRIGRYAVLGLLGRGGMGSVYKVLHPELGHVAALKVLEPMEMVRDMVGMDELVRRFEAEARAMAALRHDNVARVWDMDRDASGRPFFVMEYCCNNLGAAIGETYEVEAPTRVLPLERAVDVASQTLEGLARLHFSGAVHRDVKPFNLLLTETGQVRIIDFGLSRLRGERMRLHGAERVGSPYYAAPEQEEAPEAADARADLFSVGVTLWRMLTGRLPQCSDAAPSALNPDLDGDWDAFLRRATAANPRRRPASARAMRAELAALADAWRVRMGEACPLAPESPARSGEAASTQSRRSSPVKTGPRVGPSFFGLDGLWRPTAYAPDAFRDPGPETVAHEATGLVWQRGGTPYPLTWAEARDYAAEENARRMGGRGDWRIPTVDELVSVLAPVARGRDLCIPPVFEPGRARLWSSDLRTFTQSWSADLELGCVTRHDHTCRNHVRLVAG